MELKRDIYKQLLDWKKRDSHKVLELRGARQVGKTYILNKFAQENYPIYLYINMVQTTGQEFWSVWKGPQPGSLECPEKNGRSMRL